MRHLSLGTVLAVTILIGPLTASAQSWQPPADDKRCPSKWGAGDQRGSANHMTPANARLVLVGATR